jgi:signal transduction histidine kinase
VVGSQAVSMVGEREHASREHAQLLAQQVTAGALARAGTLAEAMPTVLGAVCECFGWARAVLWRVDAGTSTLGFESSWASASTHSPDLDGLCRTTTLRPGDLGLPARVWASGHPAWIADLEADDDRALATAARAAGLHTAFGFPVGAGDGVLGVLEFFSRELRLLDQEVIVTLASIGAQVGHFIRRSQGALDQARLVEIARAARVEAEAESKRLAFLANAGALLTSAIDYRGTLALLPRLAASTLADFCLLEVDEPNGERVRITVARSELSELDGALASRVGAADVLPAPPGTPSRELPLLLEVTDDASLGDAIADEEAALLARRVGTRSLIRVPLRTRGRAFGSMTLLRTGSARAFEAADLTLAKELAWTASMAIEKARLQRESDEALRVRNKVLSVVSHDLRNPLQVIDLNLEILGELVLGDEGSPAQRELARGLARIGRASLRMNAMIRELLDVAALQAGEPLTLDRRPTDLVPLARQLVEELQQRWKDRTIELETRLPELVGAFDAQRVERAIANLLSNAAKYSRPGGIVHVGLTREDAEAVIEVADSGTGLPAAVLPHLFDVSRRATSAPASRGGAGIGLASAHQVVTSHGGTITVASVEGHGATFTVRLPLGDVSL